MDEQVKGHLKLIILNKLQLLGLHIFSTVVLNKKATEFISHYIQMAYGTLLNIGSMYRNLEPSLIVNEPFEMEYRGIFAMCKACKMFVTDKTTGSKLFDCNECKNWNQKGDSKKGVPFRKDILFCERFVSDVLNIINEKTPGFEV